MEGSLKIGITEVVNLCSKVSTPIKALVYAINDDLGCYEVVIRAFLDIIEERSKLTYVALSAHRGKCFGEAISEFGKIVDELIEGN